MAHPYEWYPAKAQFRPGEPVELILEGEVSEKISGEMEIIVTRLARTVSKMKVSVELSPERQRISIPLNGEWAIREDVSVGYGVEGMLKVDGGSSMIRLFTAFDMAEHWKLAPRYGFLSDFYPQEKGELEDVQSLLKYHLNVIQFYDWMYRHDELIPREETFIDPMGRTLSYGVVKEKIAALHKAGMSAIAYGAVYAALADFHREHVHWGLYKANGEPYELINKFYIMDITPGSEWTDKIVSEFGRVIVEGGFDGIHLDQYGFPKHAYKFGEGEDNPGDAIDLALCYPELINQVKKELKPLNPNVGLIFNNVSNYPVHTTASADQEAVYIEVWSPFDRYRDLKSLIDRGRELSQGKHVILAAYLHAFKGKDGTASSDQAAAETAENGALLTMAVIFASGGFHLAVGEHNALLTEAYYPDYREMRHSFVVEVRRYYDFIVRYSELLYGMDLLDVSMSYTGGVNSEIRFIHDRASFHPSGGPGHIWTIIKRGESGMLIQLVNLTGIESDHWLEGKPNRPETVENICCEVTLETKIAAVYAASPDELSAAMVALPFTIEASAEHGSKLAFTLPSLSVWSMVYLEFA